MGRNTNDFSEAGEEKNNDSVGSTFGDIWVGAEPHSRFAVPHPEKPGEILRNPTGQHNPEYWVPMALDLEKRRSRMNDDNEEEDD